MATHSSILAWRIPWTGEPGGLQSTGSHRVGRDGATETAQPVDTLTSGSCCPGLSWAGEEVDYSMQDSNYENQNEQRGRLGQLFRAVWWQGAAFSSWVPGADIASTSPKTGSFSALGLQKHLSLLLPWRTRISKELEGALNGPARVKCPLRRWGGESEQEGHRIQSEGPTPQPGRAPQAS